MNIQLTNPQLIGIAVAAILIIVLAASLYIRNRRATTACLRQRFGTEYERTVKTQGSGRKGEAKLMNREKRVESLNIRDLGPTERERFLERWKSVQARFVDSPRGAVTEADDLVSSLMQSRGYPVADFEQRAADISVDHPRVTENYRTAHAIQLRLGRDETNTEDLRTAMIHYRSLFDGIDSGALVIGGKPPDNRGGAAARGPANLRGRWRNARGPDLSNR